MANSRIEREPLCTIDGCPAPSSPEFHVPFCGHGLAGHHHHVTKRSQGGVDGWVVFICARCHDDIDNGYTLEDAVLDFPALNEQRYYIYRDIGDKREYLCEKVVYPPFWKDPAECDGIARLPVEEQAAGSTPDSPRTLTEEESNGRRFVVGDTRDDIGLSVNPVDISVDRSADLTFAQWAEKCRSIGSIRHSMGFLIGDLVILGEDTFGEKAWQYLSELGYEDRSIGNMVRVCRAIPPARRNAALTYSHHVVAYLLPGAEQDKWLTMAAAGAWTVRELREAVHGVKEPPVYRCPHCQYAGVIEEFRA